MNVRYVMTPPGRHLRRRQLVASGPGSLLWDNPRALPRAFVPRKVRLGGPADRQGAGMKGGGGFGGPGRGAPPGAHGGPPAGRGGGARAGGAPPPGPGVWGRGGE